MTESTEDRAAVQRLTKITFDYSSTEDRLLARVQPVDGDPGALWITQRLARRLVDTLCAHLDKTAFADRAASLMPAPNSAAGHSADIQQKEMLLNFRREAAALNRKTTAPVPAIATDDAPLLQTIRAQLSQNRVLLTLELPDGPAALPLTQDHVWQLLQVLLNLFRHANWPVDAWPAWMRDNSSTSKTPDTRVPRALH
jgi:hypothetical protein